jgi:hypothetical protein
MKWAKAVVSRFLPLLLLVLQSCSTPVPVPQPAPVPQQKTEVPPPSEPENNEASDLQQQASIPEVPASPPRPSWPESILSAPEIDLASSAVRYDSVLLSRFIDAPTTSGWQYRQDRQKKIIGFEFSNRGGNPILPERYDIEKNRLFTRDFQFHFENRARQDIHLFVTDWAPSRDRQFRLSELMNSVMLFFPRNYLPSITNAGERFVVTLPTGEEVEFDARSREVKRGVLSEGVVDLNPNKSVRAFPAINYTGKGVMVRANARGSDPRIGTTATIISGSADPNCQRGVNCNRCEVPAKELWAQTGSARFKFSTDQEFDRYLLSRCGFGLPKKDSQFALALPQK